MSHDITSEDGLVLHARPAWHGLGTVLPQLPTVREALKVAGLEWTIEKRPLYIASTATMQQDRPFADSAIQVPDRVALQRSDTGRVLEVVSDRYEVLQNYELADLIDSLALAGDVAKAETAGSLRQGRHVFVLVPRDTFKVGVSDEVRNYLLFSNSNDGTGALGIVPTSVRVVCANTLAQAQTGFRIRHSQSMAQRIEQAREALRMADGKSASLRKVIERLARVPMDIEDRRVFFLKVYEAANGIIPSKPQTAEEERAYLRARDTVAEWIRNLDSSRNTGTGSEGTVWHALNAVTEWSDHKRTVRPGDGDTERQGRADSNLFGTSAAFKRKALTVAIDAAG